MRIGARSLPYELQARSRFASGPRSARILYLNEALRYAVANQPNRAAPVFDPAVDGPGALLPGEAQLVRYAVQKKIIKIPNLV